MSHIMEFAIVLNQSAYFSYPDYKSYCDCEEYSWKVVFEAKLVPQNNPDQLVEAAQNYCKKLNDILRKDESGKENMWQVCAHFKSNTKTDLRMSVRFHGQFLEELRELCGQNVRFTFKGKLITNIYSIRLLKYFTTASMCVHSYDTIAQVSDESGCSEFNHAIQAYCEDLVVKLQESAYLGDLNMMLLRYMRFSVGDTYINLPNGEGTFEERRYQLGVLKTIMRHEASSDISIHGVDDFKVAAHKCFLIAHSPVLKDMVKQCRFGRLKLRDVSVDCIKALLEYIYTFQISHAVKSSKLSRELFVLATKYEMYPLQDKLAKMMLERQSFWFHISATLDLFLFVRKLGRTSTINELMGKIVQVLNWNGKKHIMQSEGYQRLVIGDLNAATELCTAMANSN